MSEADTNDAVAVDDRAERREAIAATLVANHRAFLAFLEKRVGDRAVAEDILQDAFVRSIDRADDVREESAVGWFYRVLRNAVIDRHRRLGAQGRAMSAFEAELSTLDDPATDTRDAICGCVTSIAATLKPGYATALTRVSIDGATLADLAREEGITENNAAVRVHRARAALREQVKRACGSCADHGCMDCTCKSPTPQP